MRFKHLATLLMVMAFSAYAMGEERPPLQQGEASGQQSRANQNTVARFFSITPKGGQAQQLEDGIKKHIAFHRANGDQSDWYVWTVETGPALGSYLVGTLGHQWKDFEGMELGPKDGADVEANITPYVQHVSSSIWTFRSDISPAPEDKGAPAKFLEVEEFFLRPEGTQDFENTIKQITQAMNKAPAQQRGGKPPMLYELRQGGEAPRMALVFSHENWADFGPHGITVMQALQQVFGPQKAQQIMQAGGKAIRYTESQILRYRPDLSSPATGTAGEK
jgi:hypothetical protein